MSKSSTRKTDPTPAPLSRASRIAIAFKAGWEGFRPFPYPDPASALAKATLGMKLRWGFQPPRVILASLKPELQALKGDPWTVGRGETQGVTLDSERTMADAEASLRDRALVLEAGVKKLCRLALKDHELAALISFADNVGLDDDEDTKPEGLGDSSLLRYLNIEADLLAMASNLTAQVDELSRKRAAEKDAEKRVELGAQIDNLTIEIGQAREKARLHHVRASLEFPKWIHAKASKRPEPGLKNRRFDERRLFLGEHPLLGQVT